MKKLLIFIPILFLFFLIPVGLGYDFNFNTNVTLKTKDLFGRIYGYFENETLYISTSYDGNIGILSYDNSLTNLNEVGVECTAYGGTCESFDCVIRDNITLGRGFECIGSEDLANDYVRMTFIPLDTLSPIYLTSGQGSGSTHSLIYPSVSDTNLKVWKQTTSSVDLRYTITQNFGIDLAGDGSFDLPTTYENINDVQVRECGGMYHAFISKNGKVYDLIYDYNLNYKTVYLLSPIDWNNLGQEYQYGVSCDKTQSPYTLLFALVNNTYDGGRISLQKWAIGNYVLTNVWSEDLNQTEIESNVNGTSGYYINKPFLTRDGYNRYNLFYEYVNPSMNELKVSYDNSCSCSNWINTSNCLDNNILQTRICYPDNCLIEEQYVYSVYCARVLNQTQGIYEQKTKAFSDCISVDSGLVSPLDIGVLRKDVSIAIPLNCSSNLMTNSSFNLYVSASDSVFRTNKNNFTSTICNPLTSCDKTTIYNCEDAYYSNLTWNKDSDSYISGDIAKSAFIVEGYPCKVSNNFFGYEGWVKYGILGSLCYSCNINCGGKKCETVGLIDYSFVENPDCSTNATSRIECINGCDLTTGECKGGTPAEQTQDLLNPVNWINALLHPNANTKVMLGLGLSFGLGIMGLYIVGNSSNNGVIFSIGFAIGFIIFSFVNWIPIVFSVIIAFMVGVYGLMKVIK